MSVNVLFMLGTVATKPKLGKNINKSIEVNFYLHGKRIIYSPNGIIRTDSFVPVKAFGSLAKRCVDEEDLNLKVNDRILIRGQIASRKKQEDHRKRDISFTEYEMFISVDFIDMQSPFGNISEKFRENIKELEVLKNKYDILEKTTFNHKKHVDMLRARLYQIEEEAGLEHEDSSFDGITK